LFRQTEEQNRRRAMPLAARMRPRSLDEFVGQQHLLGPDRLLRRLIEADRLGSIILYGPPGTGKTTLARLLAQATDRAFVELSATSAGVKEIRQALDAARERLAAEGRATLLFIDEIHRFNRLQQDALLGDVEQGIVSLVGVTTANPYFAVNSALVSRSQVFSFEPLAPDEIVALVRRALEDPERGLGQLEVSIDDQAIEWLARICDGDARRALSALEVAVLSARTDGTHPISLERLRQSVAEKSMAYDATGDEHYDTASAIIKSLRGSDPDAAMYWLARMLEGGEDVRFICRRLVILASEDIGNADPHALPLAVACFTACEQVGLPECQLVLAQTVAYLACAPKSNAATLAISEARRDVREDRLVPVPRSLRDASYHGARQLGHGQGYEFSHDAPDAIAAQDYLGVDRTYYRPVPRGFESELAKRLKVIRDRLGKPEAD
jgi:putative ATPase